MALTKLVKTIDINAPVTKVWDTVVKPESSKEWLSVTMPGSHMDGDYALGSEVFYKSADDSGVKGTVKELVLNETIYVEYFESYTKGVKDDSAEWVGSSDRYTFSENNGVTTLTQESSFPEQYMDDFNSMISKSLEKIKEIAEK